MPKVKKPIPSFLVQARAFYAEAFAHRRKGPLADAMSEWAELEESEQSFALAHLAYLDLEAQAVTQQLLVNVRTLLDELAEVFTAALEASLTEPESEVEEEPVLPFPPETAPPPVVPDVIDAEPPGDAA